MTTLAGFVSNGFLVISTIGFVMQSALLSGLLADRRKTIENPRPGLIRTMGSRVFATGLYVCLGVWSLFVTPEVALITSFSAYSLTTSLWITQSVADRRSVRHPRPHPRSQGRHRSP